MVPQIAEGPICPQAVVWPSNVTATSVFRRLTTVLTGLGMLTTESLVYAANEKQLYSYPITIGFWVECVGTPSES